MWFILIALLVSCAAAPSVAMAQHSSPRPRVTIRQGEPTPWTRLLIEAIETAHGTASVREHGALSFSLDFKAQDHPAFQGRVIIAPPEERRWHVRLERKDGLTYGFDGEQEWVTLPEGQSELSKAEQDEAVFFLKALPHLASMPLLMRDTSVTLVPSGRIRLGEQAYHAVSMTFPGNEDWFGIFAHVFRDHIEMVSYFVRTPLMSDPEVGLPPAYVAEFHDYESTDGVLMARRWTLRRWHRVDGPIGEPLGEAQVSDVQLLAAADELFRRPEGAGIVRVWNDPPASTGGQEVDATDESGESAGPAEARETPMP